MVLAVRTKPISQHVQVAPATQAPVEPLRPQSKQFAINRLNIKSSKPS